jgi:hypothetical protein
VVVEVVVSIPIEVVAAVLVVSFTKAISLLRMVSMILSLEPVVQSE